MPLRQGFVRVEASIFKVLTQAVDNAIAIGWFTAYKFFNSLFLGLSIGSIFVIYTPLSPAVFSAGGIGLALGTLVIATQYQKLFTAEWFFSLSLMVELTILLGVIAVLVYPIGTFLALFVYIGYQFSFAFGSYLVRCETLLIGDKKALTQLDIAKQVGYLAGMAGAWVFYEAIETGHGVTDKLLQVQAMHWPLVIVELAIILLLIGAFKSLWQSDPKLPK